jgi:hypothetical protein
MPKAHCVRFAKSMEVIAREDARSCLRLAVEETLLQSILHTFVRILRLQAFTIQILRHAC